VKIVEGGSSTRLSGPLTTGGRNEREAEDRGIDMSSGDMRRPVAISEIECDPLIQVRLAISDEAVADYAEQMRAGVGFPAVEVFDDGTYKWLGDGFHRVRAAQTNGTANILANVRCGTRQDALWYALGANRTNGVRLSTGDKRHAIALALTAFPTKSGNVIAEQIGVSQRYVAEVRNELRASSNLVDRVIGKDGKSYSACRPRGARIGLVARLLAKAVAGFSSMTDNLSRLDISRLAGDSRAASWRLALATTIRDLRRVVRHLGSNAASQPVLRRARTVVKIAVDQIVVDAHTYQFKTADSCGVTGALAGVTEWEPDSPAITLHLRGDGRYYLGDGYQRVGLYRDLRDRGADLPPLRAVVLREAEGETVDVVCRRAALLNIENGTADALDVARLLRQGPLTPSERGRIPKRNVAGQTLRQAENLCRLTDDAFRWVLDHDVPAARAALVGEFITEPAHQTVALSALLRVNPDHHAEEFVRSLGDGLIVKKAADAQGCLPGFDADEYADLADISAQLVGATERLLRARRSAFATVAVHAVDLEEVGNRLVDATNENQAAHFKRMVALYKSYRHSAGTKTSALQKTLARDIYEHKCSVSDAAELIVDAIRQDMEAEGLGPGTDGGGLFGASADSEQRGSASSATNI